MHFAFSRAMLRAASNSPWGVTTRTEHRGHNHTTIDVRAARGNTNEHGVSPLRICAKMLSALGSSCPQ